MLTGRYLVGYSSEVRDRGKNEREVQSELIRQKNKNKKETSEEAREQNSPATTSQVRYVKWCECQIEKKCIRTAMDWQ